MRSDFIFDGKLASSFGLRIAGYNGVVDETLPVNVRNFNTFQPINNDRAIWTSTENGEALTTTLQMVKVENCQVVYMTEYDIEEIARWFTREDGYHKFAFIGDDNRNIYYNVKIDMNKHILGEDCIGIELIITTDSHYGFQTFKRTTFLESGDSVDIYDYSSVFGRKPIKIALECKANGDYKILHEFGDDVHSFSIKNCSIGEVIEISEFQTITSSEETHDIANDFNYGFPFIENNPKGDVNTYTTNLPCELTIEYNLRRKVGL